MFSISNPLFIYPTPWLHILPLPPPSRPWVQWLNAPLLPENMFATLYYTINVWHKTLFSDPWSLQSYILFPREQSRRGNISNLFVSSFGLLLKFICLSSFHPFCMSNKSVKLGLRGNAVGSFYLRLPWITSSKMSFAKRHQWGQGSSWYVNICTWVLI